MPSPVDALPWGSRSTISTVSLTAASAVPRFIAVVVLPTPPFWFAMARMRHRAAARRRRGSFAAVLLAGSDMITASRGFQGDFSNLRRAGTKRVHDQDSSRIARFAGRNFGFDIPMLGGPGQFPI